MIAQFFEKMDVFWTKFGHEDSVIFSEWTFFWRNMGMRAVIFSWKIGKNGILLTLGAHNIVYFWQNWRFLTEHGHDSGMFIMNTFWKKCYEGTVFLREWTFFWQNVSMRAVCFLENEHFFGIFCGHNVVLCSFRATWN